MIRTVITATAFALAAQPVLALSCAVPDIARSTQQAMDADENYRIVVGELDFDPSVAPFNGTALPDRENASISAKFNGYALTANGFDAPTRSDVILEVSCMMGSCGGVPANTEVLAFLREGPGDPMLQLGPCPTWVFTAPTEAQKQAALACVTGDCPTD